MAFDLNNFNRISSGKNEGSFRKYSYLTPDTILDMSVSSYLPSKLSPILLKDKDIIEAVTDINGTPTLVNFSYDELTNFLIIQEDYVMMYFTLTPPYFASLLPSDATIFAPSVYTDWTSYSLRGIEFVYSGSLPGDFDMEIKADGNLIETFVVPAASANTRISLEIPLPDVISFHSNLRLTVNVVGPFQPTVTNMTLALALKPFNPV